MACLLLPTWVHIKNYESPTTVERNLGREFVYTQVAYEWGKLIVWQDRHTSKHIDLVYP